MTTIPVSKVHTIIYAYNQLLNKNLDMSHVSTSCIRDVIQAARDPALKSIRLSNYTMKTLFNEACQLVYSCRDLPHCLPWASMLASVTCVKQV